MSAKRPSIGDDTEELEANVKSPEGLMSEYNRMTSPPVAYETPLERQTGAQSRHLDIPRTVREGNIENSGKYDYVDSESVPITLASNHYEVSSRSDGGGMSAHSQKTVGHYKTEASLRATPSSSQHYAVSYVTPSITKSKTVMEVC